MTIAQSKSHFDGLDDAEIFVRGTYLHSGYEGVLEVAKVHVISSRKSGDLFTVEFIVKESNEMKDPSTNQVKDPVNSRRTWQQKLSDKSVAFGEIAKFAASIIGVDPNDTDEIKQKVLPGLSDLMKEATDNPENLDKKLPPNVFIGEQVRCKMRDHTTQKNKEICVPDFAPMSTVQ